MANDGSTSPTLRTPRSDGAQARERLLLAGLRLFAESGFSKTSTRAIAQEAGVNIAAISYYFGDKAGLYAACFVEPMGGTAGELVAQFAEPGLPLEAALRAYMVGYTQPLKHGEIVRQCMRLHMREMVDPTSQLLTEFERDIKAPHEALVRVLCRHLGLARADDDVHRLALSVSGLAMQLFVMQDLIGALRPTLLDTPQHIDTWTERLIRYAVALVGAEQARRGDAKPGPAGTPGERPKRSRGKSRPDAAPAAPPGRKAPPSRSGPRRVDQQEKT